MNKPWKKNGRKPAKQQDLDALEERFEARETLVEKRLKAIRAVLEERGEVLDWDSNGTTH